MSDLNKLWKEISEKTTLPEQAISAEQTDFQATPLNVLATIRTRTQWKLYFIYFFLAAHLVLFFWLGTNWESRAIFGALILFGLINLGLVLPPYLQMKKQDLLMSGSSREVLQFYHDRLNAMLRQENLMGALFTPVAAMLGFLWAFVEKEGSATIVFSNWRLLLAMFATAIVIAPFGAWATKWMNKVAFEQYLNYLKENLERLKND